MDMCVQENGGNLNSIDTTENVWQSQVEIEHFPSRIPIALLCSKRSSVELLLRVGLIYMHCVNVVSIHEFTQCI